MIDINEVLRRAFEAGKMPPKPEERPFIHAQSQWFDMKSMVETGRAPIDLRRRADGVWCLPE